MEDNSTCAPVCCPLVPCPLLIHTSTLTTITTTTNSSQQHQQGVVTAAPRPAPDPTDSAATATAAWQRARPQAKPAPWWRGAVVGPLVPPPPARWRAGGQVRRTGLVGRAKKRPRPIQSGVLPPACVLHLPLVATAGPWTVSLYLYVPHTPLSLPAGRAAGAGGRSMKDSVMSFYTDDSPGIKIPPVSAQRPEWMLGLPVLPLPPPHTPPPAAPDRQPPLLLRGVRCCCFWCAPAALHVASLRSCTPSTPFFACSTL